MPEAFNLIRITLEEDDLVELNLLDCSDEVLTRSFQLFWTNSLVRSIGATTFRVSVREFVEKMAWLRAVWLPSGGNVDISSEVVQAVKNQQSGSSQFHKLRSLKSSRHRGARVEVPNLSLSRTLTEQQHENISYLLDMDNGANFSVPGAGKTLTTLSVWQILRARGLTDRLLVVCPRAAFESWETELSVSLLNSPASERYEGRIINSETQVVLMNYEQLENSNKLTYIRSWVKNSSAMLVLDEAHRIKGGEKSVRWLASRKLAQVANRVDILTGTPMPQGPSDLKALFSASWPNLSRQDLDERNLPSLRRNTIFVRTTKGELGLPPLDFQTIKQPPSPLQQEVLDALSDKYIGSSFLSISDSRNLAKRGKAVMTLLAAASNPALLAKRAFSDYEMGFEWPPRAVTESSELSRLIDSYQNFEVPWKIRYIALRVEEIAREGGKVLVWSNFIGTLASLKATLRKFNPALVFGGTDADKRDVQLRKFRNDESCKVLIANPQTLGEGVSLHQVCHNAIFMDRSFNAGLYLQAIDRIHRLGLAPDQRTRIELLVTQGTVDERVAVRLEAKVRKLAAFLQDEHLVAASIPSVDELSPEEILGLTDEDFDEIAKSWGIPT